MSLENVEMVRRVYDAAARHDTAAVLALYDPEVEFDISRAGPGLLTQRGVVHGHKGIRSLYRDWNEVWENYEENLEELIDAGEHVISVGAVRGRGRASGAEVQLTQIAGLWTIRGTKIARVKWFPTREEALDAAEHAE